MRNITTIILFFILTVWTADAAWIVDYMPMTFDLVEEYSGVFPYTLGQLDEDKSLLSGCSLSGPGVTEEPMDIFHFNNNLAALEVKKKVDYENIKNFMLQLECSGSDDVQMKHSIEIRVLDINDNAPIFDKASYEISVAESTPQGTDLVTVNAEDPDDSSTGNGLFTFTIISVSPPSSNLEFFIKQQKQTGQISFRGCLDYEEAQRYTIVVEAKDHGENVQLSSTSTVIVNIIDSNDHKPELSVIMGSGRVKEQENGVVVYRLEVNDNDLRGSAGWRVKYSLHGDKDKNFKIETDPISNQGILSVIKPLDFEESPQLTLLVSVENEEPLFSCKVKQQRHSDLWVVDYSRNVSSFALTFPVTITVEDVNDPPVLTHIEKHVFIMENTEAGHNLWTFTAVDQDGNSSSNVRFIKGEDVDKWVNVDSETGEVTTVKVLDRESPFVTDSTYRVTVYAVDNGEPLMTATGTLIIHLLDQNDNLPILVENSLTVCQSDEATMTNITAVDLDLPPFSGPFNYELLGDVKGKWRIEPTYGTSVSLVKASDVYSGVYKLSVKVADAQGKFSIQSLSVTVSDCHVKLSARSGKTRTVGLSVIAIAVIITSLLLGILLVMIFIWSCSQKFTMKPLTDSEGSLVNYNEEGPGNDCANLMTKGLSQTSISIYSQHSDSM